MKRPTKSDYLAYAGYDRSHKVEVVSCEYDPEGNIIDFATDGWEGRLLRRVPINQPLQLCINDRTDDRMEDILISITSEGEVVDGGFHFE